MSDKPAAPTPTPPATGAPIEAASTAATATTATADPTAPGAPGSAATRKLLNRFLDLFEKWNKSINLSAASSRDELLEHLEDSKHVVPHLQGVGVSRVLDVGSGGGFPVVVAAICLPDVSFV